jgi:pimeloyl-ACP methyl ester carboxylesterase
MNRPATTQDEVPFFFSSRGEDIFGILTEPTTAPKGVAAIILPGGAFIGATNRNRVSVRLARRLAGLGYHAARIDYNGVGESSGELPHYDLGDPFVDDLLGAVEVLEKHGIHEFVLIGSTCFGSRTALAGANRIERVRALLLFATPVRDFLDMNEFQDLKKAETTAASHYVRKAFTAKAVRGLLDAKARRRYVLIARAQARRLASRRRPKAAGAANAAVPDVASPRFIEPLARLSERRTPVLLAYGEGDLFYKDFCEAKRGRRLGAVIDDSSSTIEVRTIPGSAHGLPTLAVQDAVMDLGEEWLASLDERPESTA